MIEKSKDGSLKISNGEAKSAPKKRGRWDQTVDDAMTPSKKKTLSVSTPNSAATPVWEGDVSYLFSTYTSSIVNFVFSDRKLQQIYVGMKLLVIRVAKLLEPLLVSLQEYGTQHQVLLLQEGKHQDMAIKVHPEETVGTKLQKQKEKRRVIIVVGLKHPEPIVPERI